MFPCGGDLIGELKENWIVHEFGYVGLPDTYRIIIVTESGDVSVSDTLNRQSLHSSVTYDYTSGKATTPKLWISYLLQFLTTCIPTILIEGIILLLFGFKLKENYKVFLLINIITQVALTMTMGIALIRSGPIAAYIIQFPVEIVILVVEALVYYKYFKGKSAKRSLVYGIVANLVSWGLGFLFLSYQYEFLLTLM